MLFSPDPSIKDRTTSSKIRITLSMLSHTLHPRYLEPLLGRGRGLSKSVISKVIIGVTLFKVLIKLYVELTC